MMTMMGWYLFISSSFLISLSSSSTELSREAMVDVVDDDNDDDE